MQVLFFSTFKTKQNSSLAMIFFSLCWILHGVASINHCQLIRGMFFKKWILLNYYRLVKLMGSFRVVILHQHINSNEKSSILAFFFFFFFSFQASLLISYWSLENFFHFSSYMYLKWISPVRINKYFWTSLF